MWICETDNSEFPLLKANTLFNRQWTVPHSVIYFISFGSCSIDQLWSEFIELKFFIVAKNAWHCFENDSLYQQ